jgi:benzylsuccinate CoA-transferase BbsF subunit
MLFEKYLFFKGGLCMPGIIGLPLSGFRIVEVADAFVGPVTALYLADLGAEVIKVESPRRMDLCRGAGTPAWGTAEYPGGEPGERPWHRNSQFITANWGKYDVAIDLAKPNGLEIFYRLIKISDAFVSNFVTGVAEKLKIGYEDLIKINPNIVYLTASTFGAKGPYAKRVGMGNTADAASGILGLRDYGDGDSVDVSYSTHTDLIGAATNAFAILTGLYYRKRTGKGLLIDACTTEASAVHIGEAFIDYSMNKRVQNSLGNRDSSIYQGCYPCKGDDEWVVLSITSDEEWEKLMIIMGKPPWSKKAEFATMLNRLKNQDKLDPLMMKWTANFAKSDLMKLLLEKDIHAGAVYNNGDVFSDPHIIERQFFQKIRQPDTGDYYEYPGKNWVIEGEPTRGYAPLFGEHNHYVLSEILGISSEEISNLEQDKIISSIPLAEHQVE